MKCNVINLRDRLDAMMTPTQAIPNQHCARCGAAFRCGAIANEATCWCSQLPHIEPDETLSSCLCPDCLRATIRQQQSQRSENPS
jgi:hypothetical protein